MTTAGGATGLGAVSDAAGSRERRSPLRVALDHGLLPYLVLDRGAADLPGSGDLTIRFANERAEQVLGVTSGRLSGRSAAQAWSALGSPAFTRAAQEVLDSGRARRIQVRTQDAGTGAGAGLPLMVFPLGEHLGVVWTPADQDPAGVPPDRESARRFALAMRNAPIGMALVGTDGRVLAVNASLCRFLGHDEAALLRANWPELTHPEDVGAEAGALAEVLAGTRDTYQLSARFLHAGGAARFGEVTVAAVRAGDGSVSYLIHQVVDVTDDHRIREELERREQLYRLLSENSSDLVYRAGPDRLLTWVSPTVTATLGWSPQEMLGTRMADYMHPEDRAASEGLRVRSYAGDIPGGRTPTIVVRMRTRNGTYRWMSAQARLLTDAAGRPDGVVGGMHDVDDLVRAQRAAESATQAWRMTQLTIDSAAIGMAIVDTEGRFTQVNPALARMLGYTREQLVGRTFMEITHPDDLGPAVAALAAIVGGSQDTFMARKRYLRANGDVVWVDLSVAVVRGPGGEILHQVAQLVDVTSEVHYMAALRRSEGELRLALDGAPGGMAFANADGRIIRVNPALCSLLDRKEIDLLGRRFAEVLPAPLDSPTTHPGCPAPDEGEATPHTHHIAVGGHEMWLDHWARRLEEDGRTRLFVHQFHDQTAAHLLQRELRFRADHDPLTGVGNRESLLRRLADRRGHPTPAGHPQVAVLFVDVDHFKAINDTSSHAAGDAVLVAIAERIRGLVRAGDFVARYGGDEFVVVLGALTDADHAAVVAEKILAAAREPVPFGDQGLECSVSIGITMVDAGQAPEQILAQADQALYRAKQAGRDRAAGPGPARGAILSPAARGVPA